MARKVNIDDIRRINELYLIYGTYAAVARETGFSASTVAKYVDKNFMLIPEELIKRFDPDKDLPEFDPSMFEGKENYGELCVLSEAEREEMKQLWTEILM